MTPYFAYGSNMDPLQMAQRCPGAEARGPARLDGYRLAFTLDSPSWRGGVATVEPDEAARVWGVLWDLTDEHIATLDDYEGVDQGTYRRDTIAVTHQGEQVRAAVYIARWAGATRPSAKYMKALVRGATAFAVPEEYVRELRALLPSP